jgi:hypothetical protein
LIPPGSRRLMSSRYLREIAAWALPPGAPGQSHVAG